ncbi:GFA family protein [Pelagibacterium lentulum]|uniref:GFA family protein n=1 Tax=Pelagibacterium lentulum TaxID=2029865 RepID=UPI000F8CA03F|nr:GFA family protein [Pelagibacterium lentulum]
MKVDGSCHCGAITFEADINPDEVRVCHCTDCQQLSGTAFRVTAPCQESLFLLLTGEPKIYVKVAESGRKRQQAFCADCGSPIYATSDEPPGSRRFGLRLGTLAQRRELTPKRQFWYRSVLPWLPSFPWIAENGTVFKQ